MSIRERANEFARKRATSMIGTVITVDHLAEFAESERELQRQECAEAYRNKSKEFEFVVVIDIANAIMSAGANPTNPYGCRCEWKRDDHCNRHILWRGEVYFYSTSCDFCPSCGKAKRREQ